jgi:hypothetical protein
MMGRPSLLLLLIAASCSGSAADPFGDGDGGRSGGGDAGGGGGVDSAVASSGCFAPGERPPTAGPAGFAMPTLDDERATYTRLGWTWDPSAEPAFAAQPSYSVSDPDIHGDTEGDDLWTYLVMHQRTGQQGYLDRATAWARYFKEDYRACVGGSYASFCYDRDAFGADHMWGWGLVSWAEAMDDPAALAEAEALAGVLEELYAEGSPFGCLPNNACTHYGVRQVGRHLLLVTRVAEATGDARWGALRDKILDLVLSPMADWDEELGSYFVGEWSTDESLGQGAYAAGARVTSPFMLGVLTEAFDHAYRATGREELRRRLVAMAGFVDRYGLDPTYQYVGSLFGVVDGEPYHNYGASEPVTFWDSVYTTALVNTLMRGFRYTCETRYAERAAYFFQRGNGGVYGSPTERYVADDVVHHFVDTITDSSTGNFYMNYNKGELQYTYLLFLPLSP